MGYSRSGTSINSIGLTASIESMHISILSPPCHFLSVAGVSNTMPIESHRYRPQNASRGYPTPLAPDDMKKSRKIQVRL